VKYKIAYVAEKFFPKIVGIEAGIIFNDLFKHNLYEKLKLFSLEGKINFIEFSVSDKIDKENLRNLCIGMMISTHHTNWWLFKMKNKKWTNIDALYRHVY
jgi:hypothetical protein